MLGSATAAVRQRGSSGNSTLLLRKMLCIAALFMALVFSPLGGAGAARAQLINGGFEAGFETGALTGWSAAGSNGGYPYLATYLSNANPYTPYRPAEGNFFAVLQAGEQNVYTKLWQSFTATAGETISGYAFFSTQEGNPLRNDDGYVVIRDANGAVVATVFSADAATGGAGDRPWTFWAYTFQTGGTYTVEAGVVNRVDNIGASYIGLDGVFVGVASAPSATTEAATDVTDTSATLNATVTPNGDPTTVFFEWGTDTTYGNTTSAQNLGFGRSAVAVSDWLPLEGQTTYHYRVVATNSLGTTYGADVSFTTLNTPPPPPTPVNHAPVAVNDSAPLRKLSATINVLSNDSDPDGDTLTVSAVTNGSKGTVVINGDGTVTYTRNAKAKGNLADSFTYTISDGNGGAATATVTITAH